MIICMGQIKNIVRDWFDAYVYDRNQSIIMSGYYHAYEYRTEARVIIIPVL